MRETVLFDREAKKEVGSFSDYRMELERQHQATVLELVVLMTKE
jgi:hypothetical protein